MSRGILTALSESMRFAICPRCRDKSFEILKSHSHCASCNYSPNVDEVYQPNIPEWALVALKNDWNKKRERHRQN